MEYSLVQIAQGAGVFVGALGVAVYGAKKNGLLTFGKPKERRSCVRLCNEHAGLVKGIELNLVAINENAKKLDSVDGKVDRILGHLGKL